MMRIGLTMRVTSAENYEEPRDAVSHDWIHALLQAQVHAVLLPNVPENAESRLQEERLDLLVLTGGDDVRLAPGVTPDDASKQDPWVQRDLAETRYVDAALNAGLPIFGVCRGLQLLNLYFGGSLRTQDRDDAHVAKPHPVHFTKHAFAMSVWPHEVLSVNSYHSQLLMQESVAPDFEAIAVADDGSVEACVHRSAAVAGIMWHPERKMPTAQSAEAHGAEFWQAVERALRAHAS